MHQFLFHRRLRVRTWSLMKNALEVLLLFIKNKSIKCSVDKGSVFGIYNAEIHKHIIFTVSELMLDQ